MNDSPRTVDGILAEVRQRTAEALAVRDAYRSTTLPSDVRARYEQLTKERLATAVHATLANLLTAITGPDVANDPVTPARTAVPPEVRLALTVLLRHTDAKWTNCRAVVQQWLDGLTGSRG